LLADALPFGGWQSVLVGKWICMSAKTQVAFADCVPFGAVGNGMQGSGLLSSAIGLTELNEREP
jgi:hypothetical protein